jgi:hypothetical protein
MICEASKPKKSMAKPMRPSTKLAAISASSSTPSTIPNAFTRRSVITPRLSSKPNSQPVPQPPTKGRNRLVTQLAVSHLRGAVQRCHPISRISPMGCSPPVIALSPIVPFAVGHDNADPRLWPALAGRHAASKLAADSVQRRGYFCVPEPRGEAPRLKRSASNWRFEGETPAKGEVYKKGA